MFRLKVICEVVMISLVTGGAGFIGSYVARHCLAMGHEAVARVFYHTGRQYMHVASAT
jgi:nucleoside-diphosphate-sugar epimerase